MGKYNCEKCGKEFNQKSHYTTHTNKKNPCVVESKIKETHVQVGAFIYYVFYSCETLTIVDGSCFVGYNKKAKTTTKDIKEEQTRWDKLL